MQICCKSIFFLCRVVLDAGSCSTVIRPKTPSVLLAKVKLHCSLLQNSRVLNIYHFLNMGKPKGAFYYAVARGRNCGIYPTWDACKAQVDGFANARYKKFGSENEAKEFINQYGSLPQANSQSSEAHSSCSSRITAVKVQSRLMSHPQMALARRTTNNILQVQPKREFSTSPVLGKRKVSGERVTNKKLKCSTLSNSNVANLNDFTVDEAGYIVVYTDGACPRNGNLGAKAGIGVWFGDNHPLNLSEPVTGRQTNNTAEIQAAEKAIAVAKRNGIDKLNVQTDSQFVIKCITTWIHKWKKNNWKVGGGKPVINRTDLEKLDASMANMDIKWSYVPGHQGHYGNECADRLAVEGANKQ